MCTVPPGPGAGSGPGPGAPAGFPTGAWTAQDVINFFGQLRDFLIVLSVILGAIVIILAGWRLFFGGGSPDATTGAKRMFIMGLVGLAIALSAFAIINFVIYVLQNKGFA